MKDLIWCAGIWLVFLIAAVVFITCSADSQPMWHDQYYTGWAYGFKKTPVQKMNVDGITHLIIFNWTPRTTYPYYHPNGPDSLQLIRGGDQVYPNNSISLIDTLHKYVQGKGVKLILSIGGQWGQSATNLNWIASDPIRRRDAMRSVVGIAKRHGFDGLEIDLEPPQSRQIMTDLTNDLRMEMDLQMGPQSELLIAAMPGQTSKYDPALRNKVAHYNLMLYDMEYSASWGTDVCGAYDVTGFSAPLGRPGAEYPQLNQRSWYYKSATNSIQAWIAAGFPPEKLGMGVPFYGKAYKRKSRPNQPRCVPVDDRSYYISYRHAMEGLTKGMTLKWDTATSTPWASGRLTSQLVTYDGTYAAGESLYYSFDNPQSLSLKVQWAKQVKLGGVMVYEKADETVEATVRDPLTRAIVAEIRSGTTPSPTPIPPCDSLAYYMKGFADGKASVDTLAAVRRALARVPDTLKVVVPKPNY